MLYVKNQDESTQITELFSPITEKIPLPLIIARKVGNQNLRGVSSSPEQEEKPAPSSIGGQWRFLFKGKEKQADRIGCQRANSSALLSIWNLGQCERQHTRQSLSNRGKNNHKIVPKSEEPESAFQSSSNSYVVRNPEIPPLDHGICCGWSKGTLQTRATKRGASTVSQEHLQHQQQGNGRTTRPCQRPENTLLINFGLYASGQARQTNSNNTLPWR